MRTKRVWHSVCSGVTLDWDAGGPGRDASEFAPGLEACFKASWFSKVQEDNHSSKDGCGFFEIKITAETANLSCVCNRMKCLLPIGAVDGEIIMYEAIVTYVVAATTRCRNTALKSHVISLD